MKKQWQVHGNTYMMNNVTPVEQKLPVGLYNLEKSELFGIYLEKRGSQFTFPYRIYGKDSKFIDRVVATYQNTTANLGVLLNGIKGTGKTVTAELIANALKMAVIIVTAPYPDLVDFLNKIQQDFIVVIDEYEKIFKDDYKSMLLSIMDGVHNNRYRKVFLLTTNTTVIDDNLKQRPGRIRYLKTYGNLDKDTVEEVVVDTLERPEYKDSIIDFVMGLEIITIDIVKALVKEVNIHDEAPHMFKDCFNVQQNNPIVDVYRVERAANGSEVEVVIARDTEITPKIITSRDVRKNTNIYVHGYGHIGNIKIIRGERITTIRKEDVKEGRKKVEKEVENIYIVRKSVRVNSTYEDDFYMG